MTKSTAPRPAGTTYTKDELAAAVRAARQTTVDPDLDEKLEAVQHFFEVQNCIPEKVRRPSTIVDVDVHGRGAPKEGA